MPTYTYKCKVHGEVEVRHKMIELDEEHFCEIDTSEGYNMGADGEHEPTLCGKLLEKGVDAPSMTGRNKGNWNK